MNNIYFAKAFAKSYFSTSLFDVMSSWTGYWHQTHDWHHCLHIHPPLLLSWAELHVSGYSPSRYVYPRSMLCDRFDCKLCQREHQHWTLISVLKSKLYCTTVCCVLWYSWLAFSFGSYLLSCFVFKGLCVIKELTDYSLTIEYFNFSNTKIFGQAHWVKGASIILRIKLVSSLCLPCIYIPWFQVRSTSEGPLLNTASQFLREPSHKTFYAGYFF